MVITKDGVRIGTLEEWGIRAGPKSKVQWTDHRSAKEVARAWLDVEPPAVPAEVAAILASHPGFGQIREWTAEPERKLPFDAFSGEPRNTDLLVRAVDDHGPYVIAVEAKADEAYGQTVAAALSAARQRLAENPRSKGVRRIEELVSWLFAGSSMDDPEISAIRYQLLTAAAGAICEAERTQVSRAVLLIHEFITPRTLDERHRRNASDLGRFAHRLSSGAIPHVRDGEIQGPFGIPGCALFKGRARFFIGKVSRSLRTADKPRS